MKKLFIYKGECMNKLATQIEGLIFIAGDEGITLSQLSEATSQDVLVIEQTLEGLNKHYIEHQHALMIHRTLDVVKFVTIDEIYPTLSFYLQLKSTRQLSQSALETLAIIAYKQPITRSQIEEIRGVNCDLMVRKLQSLDLIVEAGRETTPGRPILYEVTSEFLDVFNLLSLQELPLWEETSLKDGDELFHGS